MEEKKKFALAIGLNYTRHPGYHLGGCVNDARNLCDYLVTQGYKHHDITLLTDDQNSSIYPSKDEILKAIDYLVNQVRNCAGGATAVFMFAGHGGQQPDTSGDEEDGLDENIYAGDLKTISDDFLRKVLIDRMPSSTRLICITDCCHSGTVMDLPHRFLKNNYTQTENSNPPRCRVIAISGCKDNQTSSDAFMDGHMQGAMTGNLINLLKNSSPYCKWADLIRSLQNNVNSSGYRQIPQLSAGKKEDIWSFVSF